MLADPKALQHVMQTSGYRYPKRADTRAHQRMRVGDGLPWAEGLHIVMPMVKWVTDGAYIQVNSINDRERS